MDFVFPLIMGIGLAAAAGFRIFIPFLVLCLAARGEYISLPENFEWLTTDTALMTLIAATSLEVLSFYVPWLDNALDTIASPVSLVAGTVAVMATGGVQEMDPVLGWVIAIVGGGGSAATTQALSVLTRGGSLLASGGAANPLVSTAENTGSTGFSVAAIFVPILIIPLFLLLVIVLWKLLRKRKKTSPKDQAPAET